MPDHCVANLEADVALLGQLLAAHRAMVAIRAFEEVVGAAHRDGRLPGLLHLGIGGEAVAVGVASRLGHEDRVYSSHRPHGHFLALGETPKAVIAELAGRDVGLCRGRGGSMHLMGTRAVLATGIVGGTLPIAVGHALRVGPGKVVVVFFGDGAVQTGVFHESLNLAALWNAPVLFVCENNGVAEFSARSEHTKVASVADYGPLYGLPSLSVDGAHVEAVWEGANSLLAGVRSHAGPALLECCFTRLRPHYEGDQRPVADEGRDPIALLEQRLISLGVSAEECERTRTCAHEDAESLLSLVRAEPHRLLRDDPSLVFARSL